MYAFDTAGILLGEPPSETFHARGWHLTDEKQLQHVVRKHSLPVIGYNPFNLFIFSRMLAKMAHSYAVAKEGLGSFTPLLQELILHGSRTPSYLVGGTHDLPPKENAVHRIGTGIATSSSQSGIREYLVVNIRLFCFLGTPQYEVVVGEWKGSQK